MKHVTVTLECCTPKQLADVLALAETCECAIEISGGFRDREPRKTAGPAKTRRQPKRGPLSNPTSMVRVDYSSPAIKLTRYSDLLMALNRAGVTYSMTRKQLRDRMEELLPSIKTQLAPSSLSWLVSVWISEGIVIAA